jgi:hypothetical protein
VDIGSPTLTKLLFNGPDGIASALDARFVFHHAKTASFLTAAAHIGRPEMLSVVDEPAGVPGPDQVVVTIQAIHGKLRHGCRP